MRFFKKKMSRAEAIAKAIDMSDPGDSISIHSADCTDPNICTCNRREIYIAGEGSKRPIGFGRR